MAYEKPRILSVTGRTILIDHLELPNQPKSYTVSDASAAAVSLTVLDNVGFAENQLIMIGLLGAKKTEIKKISASVTAGTTLSVTALTFQHEGGTPVQRVLFNQWKIYGNSSNTTSGATLIATIDTTPDAPYTTYVNSGTEYAYYFVLPYDSYNTVTGDDYSDGISASTGYAENTVGYVATAAIQDVKAEKSDLITNDKIIREINECLRYMKGKLKRWSALESFDYVLGQTTRGTHRYSLPSDMESTNNNQSILDVRIGGEHGLTYADKKELERLKEDCLETTVRTQAVATDTSLNVVNSYDFPDSGSVTFYKSGTKYTITYTGVTRSATVGVLTGIPATGDGSITVTIPVNTNIYSGEIEGIPTHYTVYDGYLEIWPLPDSTYDNLNVYLDYFTTRDTVNSYSDTLSGFRSDAVKPWLRWKIRSITSNATGKLDMQDGDFLLFSAILKDQIRLETTGQKFKMKPKINKISY